MKKQKNDFLSLLKKIDTNYMDIVGHRAYAVLCYLLYIKREESRSTISSSELMHRLDLDKKSLQEVIAIIKTVGLAKFSTNNGETTFQILLTDKVTLNEKKVMADILLNKSLISQSRRDFLVDYLDKKHIDNGRKVNIINKDKSIQDMDISEIKIKAPPRANTGIGLVRYYYKNLNEKFKIDAKSPNEQREAHTIKIAMKKFGDDYDTTRKILLNIIERYSRSGEYDKASNLFRYHSERNASFFDVFGVKQDKFAKEFKPDLKYSLDNCKNIYNYFKQKGEEFDFIFEKRIKTTLTGISDDDIEHIRQTLQREEK